MLQYGKEKMTQDMDQIYRYRVYIPPLDTYGAKYLLDRGHYPELWIPFFYRSFSILSLSHSI